MRGRRALLLDFYGNVNRCGSILFFGHTKRKSQPLAPTVVPEREGDAVELADSVSRVATKASTSVVRLGCLSEPQREGVRGAGVCVCALLYCARCTSKPAEQTIVWWATRKKDLQHVTNYGCSRFHVLQGIMPVVMDDDR